MSPTLTESVTASAALPILAISPQRVMRGAGILAKSGALLAQLGSRPLVMGGHQALEVTRSAVLAGLNSRDRTRVDRTGKRVY
jgi:hypothetical protein